jgi:hypothetical protein
VVDKRSALGCLFGKREGSIPVLAALRYTWIILSDGV